MDEANVEYLTVKEAAEVLRVSTATLAAWRAKGIGPDFTRHGAKVVYTRQWLNQWSAAHSSRRAAKV